MVKKVFKRTKIFADNYVNTETGELLSSEGNYTSLNEPTEYYEVSSSEYIIIDSSAKRYIESAFNNAECGRIFQMADMVQGCYNILFHKDTPHTKETLSKELEYSRNKMSDFLKKLLKESVIYYINGYKDNNKVTWIMLNPTLARKSKLFHQDCIKVFEDLSKKKVNDSI